MEPIRDNLAEIIELVAKDQGADKKNVIAVLENIRMLMNEDKHLIVPVDWDRKTMSGTDILDTPRGIGATLRSDVAMMLRQIKGPDEKNWLVAFSSNNELLKGSPSFSFPGSVRQLLDVTMKTEDISGIVINPFGAPFLLNKTLIQMILDTDKAVKENQYN